MKSLKENDEVIIHLCECHSLDHTLGVYLDKDLNKVILYPTLKHSNNLFNRIKGAIKYIFGYKSRFGGYDEFIISEETSKIILESIETTLSK